MTLTWIAVAMVSTTAVVIALLACASARWNHGTTSLRVSLEASRRPIVPATFDVNEVAGLPEPVRRYFRAVLNSDRRVVATVDLVQSGTLNLSATDEQWKPFTANQRINLRRPGFDWNARISLLPGIAVRVHDAYIAGEGILHAAFLGLISIANIRGTPEMAQGELLRFLAEAAWYPTALLPSQGVQWAAVDDHSATATLVDGGTTATLLFRFTADGLVDSIRAEARGRTVAGVAVPTPWEGRWGDYQSRGGMMVPMEGEVAWMLSSGAKPYWRGRIESITYEFAD